MAHPHWYTKAPFVARIRRALGGVIDLDPCAAHPSLDEVKALRSYLYPEQDGLRLPWRGRVFANPPYNREGIRAFADRALHQEPSCERLLMLVPLRPSASWWRDLARSADDCVLLLRRIAFIDGSASPKPGTTGRGELCIFGWRLAEVEALGGIVLPRVMQGAPLHERVVQETLFESTFSAQSAADGDRRMSEHVVDGEMIGGATLPEQLATLGRMFPARTSAAELVLGLLGQIQTKGEA